MKKWFILLGIMLFGWSATMVNAQEPIAYGVFFYSPTCPHCHEVIDKHWDAIKAQFGDQLRVIFVNVQYPAGSALMLETTQRLGINSRAVPMLILGNEALIGSIEIPTHTVALVQAGLAAGGIPIPAVAGLEEVFAQSLGADYVPNSVEAPQSHTDIANLVAVGVLVALVVSVLIVGAAFIHTGMRDLVVKRLGYLLTMGYVIVGIGLTASLLLGSTQLSVTAIAFAMAALFGITLMNLHADRAIPRYLVPLVLVIGLLVAGYMSYVEVTLNDAVCGIIGSCNVVQQSAYAALFGIPIGIIGVTGYTVLLVLWGIGQRIREAEWLLFALSMGGVLFSIYLTYLEPFVIKASCVWCLTSAVCMMLLVLLMTPGLLQQRGDLSLRRA